MTSKSLSFEFAPTGGGIFTGANDPASVNLMGGLSFTSTLARESLQNAIDASDPKSKNPVEVSFSVISVKPDQIPNIDSLKSVLVACRDLVKDKKDIASFYNSAIFKIEKNEFIEMLKISDYNTTGLTGGDDDIRGNFFLLMHSEGWTEKISGQGGSWGLGKGAYFNASSFSTFFVSSVYDGSKHIFLGRSNLASHIINDEKYQGNGSYGKKGQKAITDPEEIPSVFRRSEQGTDIYIMGFDQQDWEKEMLHAVLNFFWYPILKGNLKVEIGNYSLNSSSIDKLIRENYEENQRDKPDNQNPLPYYIAYTDKDSQVIPGNLSTLGNVEIHILKKNKFPQKIALMRKPGMVIMKKQRGSLLDYAAVFICEDEDGDEILRAMESPKHDIWDPNYARKKPSLYELTKKASKELDGFLTDSIKKITPNITSSFKIGDLDKYLSLEGDEESEEGPTDVTGNNESVSDDESAVLIASLNDDSLRTRNEILKIKEIKQEVPGVVGGDLPLVGGKGGGGESTGGSESEDGNRRVLIDGISFRTFDTEENGRMIHHVRLKGNYDRKFNIDIKAGTDDYFEPVEIDRATDDSDNPLDSDRNTVKNLSLKSLGGLRLKVKFKDNEKLALNVAAYEI